MKVKTYSQFLPIEGVIQVSQTVPTIVTIRETGRDNAFNLRCVARKPVFGVSDQVRQKQAVQRQKMARGLKFRIEKAEGLYYLNIENKAADQLCSFCAADLLLCFHVSKKQVFS